MNKLQWPMAPMGISQEETSTRCRSVKRNKLWQDIGCCPLVDLHIKCRWNEAIKLKMRVKVAIKNKTVASCFPLNCAPMLTWSAFKMFERHGWWEEQMDDVTKLFSFPFSPQSLATRSLFCPTERKSTVNAQNYHLYLTVCWPPSWPFVTDTSSVQKAWTQGKIQVPM